MHGKGWPAHRLNLFKNTVAVVGLGLSLLLFPAPLPTQGWIWRDLILSGVVGIAVSDTAAFVILETWGAQVASSSFCLSPPFTALISWLILGETLSVREWLGLTIAVLSIMGVVLLGSRSKKNNEGRLKYSFWVILLCCLLCPLTQAIGAVWAKRALSQVDPLMASFVRMLASAVILVLFGKRLKGITWGNFRLPSVKAIFWGSFIGALLGVYLMSLGLSLTKAGIAGTLAAIFPLWVIPISHWYLKEKVTRLEIVFTITAISGVIIMLSG